MRRAHHDLKSFLQYTLATSPDQTQKVWRGTLYEYQCQIALCRKFAKWGLGSLRSVAGTADRGMDLVGDLSGVPMVVQCKSSQSKIAPNIWRELAGVYLQKPGSLIVCASPNSMTSQAYRAFVSIKVPFLHCRVRFEPVFWNSTLNRLDCSIGAKSVKSLLLNPSAEALISQMSEKFPC